MAFQPFSADLSDLGRGDLIFEGRLRDSRANAVAAAKKGFDSWIDNKGYGGDKFNQLSKMQQLFFKMQHKQILKSGSRDGSKASPTAPTTKAGKKKGSSRGFGYMSLPKALKQLRGMTLNRIIDQKILDELKEKMLASRGQRTGKRGRAIKKRTGMTAKSAEKLALWAKARLSARYPFSEKSKRAPKTQAERILNKAKYIRGLSLILKDILSRVGGQNAGQRKEQRGVAKGVFDEFKKNLKLLEWSIQQDLKCFGEAVNNAFMNIVEDAQSVVDKAFYDWTVLSETVIDERVAWSDKVKTKINSPQGLFARGSAKQIAEWAYGVDKDAGRAAQRITFYLNRAGNNLPSQRKQEIHKSLRLVQAMDESFDQSRSTFVSKIFGEAKIRAKDMPDKQIKAHKKGHSYHEIDGFTGVMAVRNASGKLIGWMEKKTVKAEGMDEDSSIIEGHDLVGMGKSLQHWHSGAGTPVHRVGAMLYAGRKPWRRDVCDAVEELQALMMDPRYGDHEDELRSIIGRLRTVCAG